MSFQAVAWAFESRLDDPALKLTLVACASYANAEDETWHSQTKIAWDVGISDRTLRRKLSQLQDLGFLEVVERRREDGTKQTSLIRLCRERKSDQPVKLTAGINRTKTAPTTGQKPGSPPDTTVAEQESKRTEKESSIVRVEGPNGVRHIDTNFCELPLGDAPAKKLPKKRGIIPANYPMTDEHKRFARELGFANAHTELLFENFKDYHAARGSLMIDWMAAWRTWVRRDVQFNGAKRPPTSQQPGYGDDWG